MRVTAISLKRLQNACRYLTLEDISVSKIQECEGTITYGNRTQGVLGGGAADNNKL